jgi:hypothetical protein
VFGGALCVRVGSAMVVERRRGHGWLRVVIVDDGSRRLCVCVG